MSGYEQGWEPDVIPHTNYVHSCTLNSFNTTSLTLKSYDIVGSPHGVAENPILNASFTIFNPATLDEYELHEMVVQDDGAWHQCVLEKAMPWQLIACDYMLNRAKGSIGFRFQWYCDDRDPYHA